MSTDRTSIGDRMRAYEQAFVMRMPRRMPVIIRVDGRAFHTLLRHAEKPFDLSFMAAMDDVAIALCEQIQGAQLAYAQSDEVSVLIHNYKRLNSEAWFDNEVQKMTSVAASIATAAFNSALQRRAHFDARAFVVPESEVCNALLWRQQDATRNSIQMLARSLYSHKECENKNTSELQEMCFQKGHNWNDLPTEQRRGRCAVNAPHENPATFVDGKMQPRPTGWVIDREIPIFSQNRNYIERHLLCDEETAA